MKIPDFAKYVGLALLVGGGVQAAVSLHEAQPVESPRAARVQRQGIERVVSQEERARNAEQWKKFNEFKEKQSAEYMKAYDEINEILKDGYGKVSDSKLLDANDYCNWLIREKIDFEIFPEMREKRQEIVKKRQGVKIELRKRIENYFNEGKKNVARGEGEKGWRQIIRANDMASLFSKGTYRWEFPKMAKNMRLAQSDIRSRIIYEEWLRIRNEVNEKIWFGIDADDPYTSRRADLIKLVYETFDGIFKRVNETYNDKVVEGAIHSIFDKEKNGWLDYLSRKDGISYR